MNKLIVFIGPQGSGKTTQAYLLLDLLSSRQVAADVISFSNHAFFQEMAGKMLIKISGNKTIFQKFHENMPPKLSPSPEVYKKSHVFLVLLHIVNLVLAKVKQNLLGLFYDVILEPEGYSVKQLADLHFAVPAHPNSVAEKLLKVADKLLLSTIDPKKWLIVYLEGQPPLLKQRYLKRKTGIEPAYYINFQDKLYHTLLLQFSLNGGQVLKIYPYDTIQAIQNQIADSLNKMILDC